MDILMTIIAGVFLFLGLFGIWFGIVDNLVFILVMSIIIFISGALILIKPKVPNCDTITVQSNTVTVKGSAYSFDRVKICDNGKIQIKGKKVVDTKGLPKVTVN